MTTQAGLGLGDSEREQRLLYRIIDTITAGLDLAELVRGVAAIITEATATDVCFVHLLDVGRRRLVLAGATPPFDTLSGTIELAMGEGLAGWVAAHAEPAVITESKRDDPRYKYIPQLRGEDYTSVCSVPMISAPGRLVGVLNVHSRARRDFSASDVGLLRAIANLMAGAVENARLHRWLEEREHARERFAERLIQAQEHERRRLAGEIHDGISQRIVGLSFHLSAVAGALDGDDVGFARQQLLAASALADAALDETRTTIAGLRPSVLDDLGLAASLESLARSVPHLSSQLEIDEQLLLPEHVETALYRIAQEALQNVVKHAGAGLVRVRLEPGEHGPVLEIADDGRGFDPRTVRGEAQGAYGLAGIRERADLIGAHVTVVSAPGAGTVVKVSIPHPRPQRMREGDRSESSGSAESSGSSGPSGAADQAASSSSISGL